MEINRMNVLAVCEEYIHQVWCMENLKDGGMFAVYGLEQHRVKLHDELCDLLEIDHEKSKDILSYLDEKIGLDYSKMPSGSELRNYAEKLLDLLNSEKANGELNRDLVKLHDMALDYENDIDASVDTIRSYRIKMIDKRNAEILKSIIPVLDILSYEIEQYKEWLEEI